MKGLNWKMYMLLLLLSNCEEYIKISFKHQYNLGNDFLRFIQRELIHSKYEQYHDLM